MCRWRMFIHTLRESNAASVMPKGTRILENTWLSLEVDKVYLEPWRHMAFITFQSKFWPLLCSRNDERNVYFHDEVFSFVVGIGGKSKKMTSQGSIKQNFVGSKHKSTLPRSEISSQGRNAKISMGKNMEIPTSIYVGEARLDMIGAGLHWGPHTLGSAYIGGFRPNTNGGWVYLLGSVYRGLFLVIIRQDSLCGSKFCFELALNDLKTSTGLFTWTSIRFKGSIRKSKVTMVDRVWQGIIYGSRNRVYSQFYLSCQHNAFRPHEVDVINHPYSGPCGPRWGLLATESWLSALYRRQGWMDYKFLLFFAKISRTIHKKGNWSITLTQHEVYRLYYDCV